MNKSINLPVASSAGSPDRLPPRQRWDQRYSTFPPRKRSEPIPFVAACLPKLPEQGRALDIAAGAGRHTIALARRGLSVDAVDISWSGLRLAQQRAIEANLIPGRQIHFIVADVERPWLPYGCYEVILVALFLYRPLFPLIKDRLAPGGWLVYETFIADPETALAGHSMRREFLLERNELKDAFSDFEILFYDESHYNSKATAQLLARKPKVPFICSDNKI